MKYSLIAGLVLAMGLSACGKKQEAAAPEPAPAPAAEAPAPMAAPAPEAAAPAPAAFDAAATYKNNCASCHGDKGEGVATFPKLAGKTAADVKAKLADYKAGKTVGPQTAVMAPNAGKLSDSEIDAMATYIATLK
ncbi:MAG: c-type cytochrome [Thiobacillaceae bacterium]